MTIVDLTDLDTFIRDSLFEVRRGIANSRNATQANPLNGVMVDLPEKIDFEIMVTSAHQGLTRNVVSSDLDKSSEVTSESQKSLNTTNETGGARVGASSLTLSQNSENSREDQTELTKEVSQESQLSQDGDKRNGKSDSVEGSQENDQKQQQSGQWQSDTKKSQSKQVEVHAEANDRASKTFDEEEGTWGGQGQLSTPQLPLTPCTCT
jgi:hypothetical protein